MPLLERADELPNWLHGSEFQSDDGDFLISSRPDDFRGDFFRFSLVSTSQDHVCTAPGAFHRHFLSNSRGRTWSENIYSFLFIYTYLIIYLFIYIFIYWLCANTYYNRRSDFR